MSYILDALRKSEEARRRQQGPDLTLTGTAPEPERNGSFRIMPWLILALLINAGVLGIWLFGSGTQETTTLPPMRQAEPMREAEPMRQAEPPSSETAPPPAARPEPASITPPEPEAVRQDWRQQPVLRLSELPAGSRNRFPALSISTHIYAEEPAYREVTINGRRYQEGDGVAGLDLLAITETGVLLQHEGTVVRVDLTDAWGL